MKKTEHRFEDIGPESNFDVSRDRPRRLGELDERMPWPDWYFEQEPVHSSSSSLILFEPYAEPERRGGKKKA